jgi:hypothetical protein
MNIKRIYNELCRIGGTKFALEMHKRFEGEQVSVAYRKGRWYKSIEELLDEEVADEFFEKYNKSISIYIGKVEGLFRDKRNERIKKEYASGTDYRIIARKHGLTASYVRKLVEHHPIRDRREKLKKDRQKEEVKPEK